MFEGIPHTRVMSEPYSFLFVWNMYLRGEISLVEYETLLQSTFEVQCKKERGINRIVIKHNMCATPCLSALKKWYPEIQLLFITRHPLPSLKSYDKLWNLLPISGTFAFLSNVNGIYWKNYPIPYDNVIWWERYRNMIQEGCTLDQNIAMVRVFLFNYWCVVEQYITNKVSYKTMILYEDLCENPTKVLEDVFSVLNISLDNIPIALCAMKKDSQQGFFGNRGSNTRKPISKVIGLVNKKFQEYDIPIQVNMPMQDFRNLFD